MKLGIKTFVLLISGLFFVTTAQAQIDVDVDIDVGSITILSSFTDIDITIPDTALAALVTAAETNCTPGTGELDCDEGSTAATATVSGSALTADFDIVVPTATLGAVSLTLTDVWAVRAIGGAGTTTTVTASLGADASLTNGASVIEVDAVSATPATFTDPGLATPEIGDIALTLDFSQTTLFGLHDGDGDTGDAVYVIEVTGT